MTILAQAQTFDLWMAIHFQILIQISGCLCSVLRYGPAHWNKKIIELHVFENAVFLTTNIFCNETVVILKTVRPTAIGILYDA